MRSDGERVVSSSPAPRLEEATTTMLTVVLVPLVPDLNLDPRALSTEPSERLQH